MIGVSSLSYSESGGNIISVTLEGDLRLHDGYTGSILNKCQVHNGQAWSVDIDSQHQLIAVGTGMPIPQIRFFKLSNLVPWAHVSGFKGIVYDIHFSFDGAAIIASEGPPKGDRLSLIPLKTLWCDSKPNPGTTDMPSFIHFEKPSAEVTIKDMCKALKTYKIERTGSLEGTIDLFEQAEWLEHHQGWIHTSTWSSDGRLVVSGDKEGFAIIWDILTRQPKYKWRAHRSPINSSCFHPNNISIVLGSDDGTMSHWLIKHDDQSLYRLKTISTNKQPINALNVSSDGNYVVFGTRDGYIVVWDLFNHKEVIKANLGSEITSIAFSPTGKRVACGDSNGSVHVFEIENVKTCPPILTPRFQDNGLTVRCPYCSEKSSEDVFEIDVDDWQYVVENNCPRCGQKLIINNVLGISFDEAQLYERDSHIIIAILWVLFAHLNQAIVKANNNLIEEDDVTFPLTILNKMLKLKSLSNHEKEAILQTANYITSYKTKSIGAQILTEFEKRIKLLALKLREGNLNQSVQVIEALQGIELLLANRKISSIRAELTKLLYNFPSSEYLYNTDIRLKSFMSILREMIFQGEPHEGKLELMLKRLMIFSRLMVSSTPF
jgi:WD40 repeat protein